MNPAVSVIIPAYNRSRFLEKAVESVLDQRFSDYELIIVDDGSTDDTASVVKKYGNSIRYIRQENRGPSAARNRGIEASRGNLVAFLDSDDWWHRDKLSVQTAAMNSAPKFFISHTEEIWYRGGKLLNPKKKHRKLSGEIFQKSLKICMVSMSTVMVRRYLFDLVGLFDEDLPCCEDYDFWLRVAVSHRFLLIDRPLTYKEGGRNDQVSVIYRVGMDRFRIKSLVNLLRDSCLQREQEELAVAELKRKCRIYGNGCIKHGRREEGAYYLALPEKVTRRWT